MSARQHGVEPIKAELRILKSEHVARRQKKIIKKIHNDCTEPKCYG